MSFICVQIESRVRHRAMLHDDEINVVTHPFNVSNGEETGKIVRQVFHVFIYALLCDFLRIIQILVGTGMAEEAVCMILNRP